MSIGHVLFTTPRLRLRWSQVPALIDAISEVDDATPLVWENNGGCKELVLQGVARPSRHAHCMSHYDMPARPPPPPGGRQALRVSVTL